MTDLLSYRDIAALLGVHPDTARVWHQRGRLPAPAHTVANRPAWHRETIQAWAQATGRVGPDYAALCAKRRAEAVGRRPPGPRNAGPPGGETAFEAAMRLARLAAQHQAPNGR